MNMVQHGNIPPSVYSSFSQRTISKHYKIITGHARGIGSYVISAIVEECQNNVSKLEKHLMIKAFPYEDKNRNDYKELVTTYREEYLKMQALQSSCLVIKFPRKV